MQHFAHDDLGYLGWLAQHPAGFHDQRVLEAVSLISRT